MNEKIVHTVKGPIAANDMGLTLPHEHLFTDLRGPQVADYAQADPADVVAAMRPFLEAAYAAGVRSFVECSTAGVGRNVIVLQQLAQATPINLIAPTGVYRQGFIPEALAPLSAEVLAQLWVREITEGIDGTDVKAGFIKIAASDEGVTPLENRNLQAAALASVETGAVVASHTIGGAVARQEMDILAGAGLDLARFIWVHAQTEADQALHREAAERGAFLEFDAIGAPYQDQESMLAAALALIEAGHTDQILLSHDAGWYQPGAPSGQPDGGMRGYTALFEDFLPVLRARGVADDVVQQITVLNPARAFALAPR
jgi:phosphotriesterase-related protein